MRLRWALVGVVVFVGVVLLQNPWVFTPLENTTVYALDYFTAHRLPRTGFSYELCCGDWWTGASVSSQYNYSTPLRHNLNLSNLFLTRQGNDVLQTEYAGGGDRDTWDLSSISTRSRTLNFTVTDTEAGNVTLVFGRKPINASTTTIKRCGVSDTGYYGTSYNATLANASGSLISAYYYQLPDGDSTTSLLPLTDPTAPLNLSAGGYSLKVDYWLYAYDSMPVCYKGRYNYYLNDPILLKRYTSNAPPVLDSMSSLNTSYHIASSVVGRALDDIGVYSVKIASNSRGSGEAILEGVLGNKSFKTTLNALLNGSEDVNVTVTDAYNQSTTVSYSGYVADAPDMVIEGVSGLKDLLLGDTRNITVTVLNNGTLAVVDATLNFSHGRNTGVNLGVGERRNLTLSLNTSGWRGGNYVDFVVRALNNTLEYDADNTQTIRAKVAFNQWASNNNVSLYWKNTSIQRPDGTEIGINYTSEASDYATFDFNAADYGIPYFHTVFGIDQARLQADGKALRLRVWNSSNGSWSTVNGPIDGWIINKTEAPGAITIYNYHYSDWGFIVEDDTTPAPSTPPPSSPSGGSGGGGGGGGTLVYAVIGNDIDYPLAWPYLEEALNKTSWADGMQRYAPGNWSYQAGYCPDRFVACVLLGGHLALGGMGNHTAPLLDAQDRAELLSAPSYFRVGRVWILAGASRRETALAVERWADEIIK